MTETLKDWQHGIPLERLQAIEDEYDKKYNKFSLSPFTEMNKPAIAGALHEGDLYEILGVKAIITRAKVNTPIKVFGKQIDTKHKGCLSVSCICYETKEQFVNFVKEFIKTTLTLDIDGCPTKCFFYVWEEDKDAVEALKECKFNKICSQFKSTGEIIGIYTNYAVPDRVQSYDKRVLTEIHHPTRWSLLTTENIAKKLSGIDFGNHYSNYSKGKVWTAVSLQGYSQDVTFIEKPKEMLTSKKFAKNYGHTKDWELQKTKLYDLFEAEINEIINNSCLKGQKFDRIRLMKLDPGGLNKEIQRHTDQSDPDIGTEDGQIMRFHVPIVTNPDVKFSAWSYAGEKITFNPQEGSMFVLDLRKPHAVVNEGKTTRVHLVFDVVMNEEMRKVISNGQLIG